MIVEPGTVPTATQIDAVLAFEERLSGLDGSGGYRTTSAFMEALYENGFIVNYDWPAWQEEASRYFDEPERVDTAGIEVIQRLLTVHARQDRFMEGHFEWFAASDHARQILARLRQIREGSA